MEKEEGKERKRGKKSENKIWMIPLVFFFRPGTWLPAFSHWGVGDSAPSQ